MAKTFTVIKATGGPLLSVEALAVADDVVHLWRFYTQHLGQAASLQRLNDFLRTARPGDMYMKAGVMIVRERPSK